MRERGLPLSPMMARATLRAEAPKTMTRRIINPQPWARPEPTEDGRWQLFAGDEGFAPFLCPYGVPGDRLWGREAWRTLEKFDCLPPRDVPRTAPIWYEADGKAPPEFGRYRHGRFMMRWMSRILRVVESIGVERLQDISEADAMAEGVEPLDSVLPEERGAADFDHSLCGNCGGLRLYTAFTNGGACPDTDCRQCDTYVKRFRALWESINGAGSWEANPWVWVIGYGEVPA
jgi:hypothetical protein